MGVMSSATLEIVTLLFIRSRKKQDNRGRVPGGASGRWRSIMMTAASIPLPISATPSPDCPRRRRASIKYAGVMVDYAWSAKEDFVIVPPHRNVAIRINLASGYKIPPKTAFEVRFDTRLKYGFYPSEKGARQAIAKMAWPQNNNAVTPNGAATFSP